MTNVKSLLEMYVKMGGSLTDTYSDIAGGVPVGQYSTISDAVLACSKKYSASGGGGAEKFVVTLTQDEQTEEWTADKKVAEIMAADAAGKIVEGSIELSADTKASLLFTKIADTVAVFAGVGLVEGGIAIEAGGVSEDSVDSWFVYTQTIPTSTNAPLIVTLTVDQSTGNLVGDKTYQECYTAFHGGRRVTFNATIESVDTSASVLAAGLRGGNYSLAAYFGDSILSASGAATDYVTFNLQG